MSAKRKPHVNLTPVAGNNAAVDERIVEISDNRGHGIGTLMAIRYSGTEEAPGLAIEIYRRDPQVSVTVEGCTVVPNEPKRAEGPE